MRTSVVVECGAVAEPRRQEQEVAVTIARRRFQYLADPLQCRGAGEKGGELVVSLNIHAVAGRQPAQNAL